MPLDPDDQLRFLFASAFVTSSPTDECPEPEDLHAVAIGEPSPDRDAIVDHVATCPVCGEAWRLARNAVDDAPIDADLRVRLLAVVRRVRPAWLADQEEDLVQIALVKLMRSEAPIGRSAAFLRRVAYSVVVDEIRRTKRRSETGFSPSLPDRIANSGELSPEVRARGGQIGATLLRCLEGLAPDRRRAVALYLQDHPVPEIADRFGWDRKRAANLVYRGLEDLRVALSAEGLSGY